MATDSGPLRALLWEDHGGGLYSIVKPSTMPLRTMAYRSSAGDLVLFSPSRNLGEGAHDTLPGVPRWLVAPNHYHHLGLPEFAGRYPKAEVVASVPALARLRRQTGLKFNAIGDLSPDVRVIVPPSMGQGEVIVSVPWKGGRAWLVGDAFFNLPEHMAGPVGWFCRLAGITAGLRIGDTFRWLGPKDREGYREYLLDELRNAPPTLLLPCHGDPDNAPDLARRINALLKARI